ncbi:hypothetical protein [Pseudomonas koreensis]|uniref:hypothetical protein n=1 Tax=Pseudomonas koreensis TaxID=198620 RepID=UPI0018E67282|nr:hypothetical protein [Pseudomonas koreensis]MBI6948557.1 hypothetical protein [Pseudomonas koreensis]
MSDYEDLQKRCQRGATNLNDANNLLAECYGMLGKLGAENEVLRKDAADVSWMVEQRDRMRDSIEDLTSLARRTLWIAFCWNDHNFDHPHLLARKEAEELGITTFEQANAWLEAQG